MYSAFIQLAQSALKKPATWFIVIIVGLLVWIKIEASQKIDWQQKAVIAQRLADQYHQRADFAMARLDTMRAVGTYIVDTVYVERLKVEMVAGKPCTTRIGCPELSGYVKFDTTKWIGAQTPFGVHVSGRTYWPDKYKSKNWMVIDVLGYAEPQIDLSPKAGRSGNTFAAGLGVARSTAGTYGPGIHLRFGRASVTYDRADAFKTRKWAGALRYDLLKF